MHITIFGQPASFITKFTVQICPAVFCPAIALIFGDQYNVCLFILLVYTVNFYIAGRLHQCSNLGKYRAGLQINIVAFYMEMFGDFGLLLKAFEEIIQVNLHKKKE